MLIQRLQVAGLRSFEQAEFRFQKGMNLIVGINGVGKTTVLDALRICMSRVMADITAFPRSQKIGFEMSDIRIGSDALEASCDFEAIEKHFNLLIHKPRPKIIEVKADEITVEQSDGFRRNSQNSRIDIEKQRGKIIRVSDFERVEPSLLTTFPNARSKREQPLAIFFSTRRSLIDNRSPSKERAAGEQAAAFADSLLADRELRIRLIAQWFRAQEELGKEVPDTLKHVEALKLAVSQFLPHFTNLRVTGQDGTVGFEVDKQGVSLGINQLSDGERGVLAIVLDLARRLSQANPGLEDPIRDGAAIVLIDELDLHLHPKWQRSIVENLTRTFQNCQFIASTHSPQIIPAVEPERVQLLKDNKVLRPDRTLGMDSNWILRHLMETDDRPEEAAQAIEKVEDLVTEGEYETARSEISIYKQQGLDLPEWSMLEARIARLEMFDEE